jgi:hypothetical protein
MMEAMGDALPESIRKRVKSDYIDVVRERVEPGICLEVIRTSGVRLPDVDYARLFRDGDADPRSIPVYYAGQSRSLRTGSPGRSERGT